MMWRVNREAVLLGSGPAALLLQIAHPLVAEGVAAHSDYEADPFGRLRRTLHTTLDLVFGDGPAAERAVRRLNAVHARVQGEVRDPAARTASRADRYRALDPELLLWVQATLVIMSVRAYRSWVGPLSAEGCERLWQETRRTGRLLGIPLERSPSDWPALVEWFEAQISPGGPVVVTDTALRLSGSILHPPIPYLPRRLMDLAMLPGLGLLPPSVRDGFGIAWGPGHELAARTLGTGLHAWVRSLPRSWRAMPQARAAERRTRRPIFGDARSGHGWATIHVRH
jgi:uncharacterized protein (DUF2236 family)